MRNKSSFIRDLITEVRTWTEQGIITRDQQKRIESMYLPLAAVDKAVDTTPAKKNPINVTAVIIALGALCLGVGIIIFYAANWRKMPPTLKLVQVFLLIIGSYTTAAWFLSSEARSRLLGRAFLLVGMISYGAGIMLVAQIYHISAHPTNGLLAWAIGAFIMSVLMKERFGLYLASLLFFIWNAWEFGEFDNPAYAYPVFVSLGAIAYWHIKDKIGITASFCFLLYYFFQATAPVKYSNDSEIHILYFVLLFLPLGSLLFTASAYLKKHELFYPAAVLMSVTSWFIFIFPFTAVSWPFTQKGADIIASFHISPMYSSLYIIFMIATGLFIYLLRKQNSDVYMRIAVLAFPVIAFFLPLGNNTVRMVSFHIAVTALIFALLYFSYAVKDRQKLDITFAYIFAFIIIIVKACGFIALSFISEKYKIGYSAGFIIFALVCLLLNSLVSYHVRKNGDNYPAAIIHALCASLIWITVYAASFESPVQNSIMSADSIVIVMIVLFSTIAVALFALLVSVLKEHKTIIYLAAAIFSLTLFALFLAGPGVSWVVYSLIFNILLLVISCVYIYYSTIIQSKVLLNIMVCSFILHIFTRYFDLFWDMLSGSALFIATGIIGLAGGYVLERKRRTLVLSMEKNTAPHSHKE